MTTIEQKLKQANDAMDAQALVDAETDMFFYDNPRKPLTLVEVQTKVLEEINKEINMELILSEEDFTGTDWMAKAEEIQPYLDKSFTTMIERRELVTIETATGPGYMYFENAFGNGFDRDLEHATKIIALMTVDQRHPTYTLDKEMYDEVIALKKAIEDDVFSFELTTSPEGNFDIPPLMTKVQLSFINKETTWAVVDLAARLFVQKFDN